jgi:hypothetical protein
MILIHHQHLSGFAAFERSDNSGYFQLIDNASGTVVANREFTLNKRCRTLLIGND